MSNWFEMAKSIFYFKIHHLVGGSFDVTIVVIDFWSTFCVVLPFVLSQPYRHDSTLGSCVIISLILSLFGLTLGCVVVLVIRGRLKLFRLSRIWVHSHLLS